MSASRAIFRSCTSVTRSLTTPRVARSLVASARITPLNRQFTSSTRSYIESVQTPSETEAAAHDTPRKINREVNARSIALLSIPRRASKSEIVDFLKFHELDYNRIVVQLNRYTFHNNTIATVELKSVEQAKEAVEKLEGVFFQKHPIYVKPLKEDYVTEDFPLGSHYFLDEGTGARDALLPLLESRRTMLSVKTPGWGPQDAVTSARKKTSLQIIREHFGKYEIENIGSLSPFYGDKQQVPRILCMLDFKTKQGADDAIRDLHDTEIEGRLTWLQRSVPSVWRANQIGKVDPALLAELQDKGLAPLEVREDRFTSLLE